MIFHDGLIDRIYQYLLVSSFFFLPLTVVGNNITIWLITLIWIFSGNYRDKFTKILSNKFALASIFFFFIHVLGLLWTENFSWGLQIVRKMLPFFLVLPILLTISKKQNVDYYISAFLLAILISVSLSLMIWFELIEPFGHAGYSGEGLINATPLMSHISYNVFIAFAFYIVIEKILFDKKLSLLFRTFFIFFALMIAVNMFVTGGRAGQVMFFVSLIVISFQYFKGSYFKAILIPVLVSSLIIFTAYSSSQIFNDRVNAALNSIDSYAKQKETFHQDKLSLGSVGYRIIFLVNSYELIKHSPFLGVGTGDFPGEYYKVNLVNSPSVPTTVNPHNMYFLVLAQLGILGLIGLLSIFYYQFKFALILNNKLENHIGIAMPIFFLVIMFSDSYLLGHFTSNLFILFSSFLYSNQN
jgi:O-antigen ligase